MLCLQLADGVWPSFIKRITYLLTHAIYTARNIVDRWVSMGYTANLCAIDLTIAFDKVNYFALYIKLMKMYVDELYCLARLVYFILILRSTMSLIIIMIYTSPDTENNWKFVLGLLNLCYIGKFLVHWVPNWVWRETKFCFDTVSVCCICWWPMCFV